MQRTRPPFRTRTPRGRFLQARPAALAVAVRMATLALLAAGPVQAEFPAGTAPLPVPMGGSFGIGPTSWVSAGRATAVQSATRLEIHQATEFATYNWRSFDVAPGHTVDFAMPGQTSVALNRIFQGNPSQIFGAINANGQVYLINSNGFVFGAGAQVNVGGLIASALDVAEADVLAGLERAAEQGRPAFSAFAGGRGDVHVAGGARIRAVAGGRILLFAANVRNDGSLVAPGGQVVLAAGDKVYLTRPGDPNLRGFLVEVDADRVSNEELNAYLDGSRAGLDSANVTNDGHIEAAGGQVSLIGLAVRQRGTVTVNAVERRGSSIRLVARARMADPLRPGQQALRHGRLDVSSTTAVVLDGARNELEGGQVNVIAPHIELARGGGDTRITGRSVVVSTLERPATTHPNTLITTTPAAPNFEAFAGAVGGASPSQALTVPGSVSIQTLPGPKADQADGGRVLLLGPRVTVERGARITADEGQVLVAAGDAVYLGKSGDPDLRGYVAETRNRAVSAAQLDALAAGTLAELESGVVRNFGTIQAGEGNVLMVGPQIVQAGDITTSTSTAFNGSVFLLGRDIALDATGAHRQAGEKDDLSFAPSVLDVNLNELTPRPGQNRGGLVRLAAGSRTDVLLDLRRAAAIDEQAQLPSVVRLSGRRVVMEEGASITAPGGEVTAFAHDFGPGLVRSVVNTSHHVGFRPSLQRNTGIHLQAGSLIDVAGASTEVPESQFITTVLVVSEQTRDTPVQRTGALRGERVTFDLRETGLREDGSRWYGSPLVDLTGSVAGKARDVFERNSAGGSIRLVSSGDLLVAPGATLDVSGGTLHYPATVTPTSRLVKDGRFIDLADADPLVHYDAVIDPREPSGFVVDWGARWDTTTRYCFSALAGCGGGTLPPVPGYSQGQDAGRVELLGTRLVMAGDLVARTAPGIRQREASRRYDGNGDGRADELLDVALARSKLALRPELGISPSNALLEGLEAAVAASAARRRGDELPLGARLVVGQSEQPSRAPAVPRDLFGGVVVVDDAIIAAAPAFVADAASASLTTDLTQVFASTGLAGAATFLAGAGEDLPTRTAYAFIDSRAIGAGAAQNLSLYANDRVYFAPAASPLDLANGSLAVVSSRVDLAADILAPAARLDFALVPTVSRSRRSQEAVIHPNVTIDLSGRWVNDVADVAAGRGLQASLIDAGSLHITTDPTDGTTGFPVDHGGVITLAAGSRIRVEGGARLAQGLLARGAGGDVKLVAVPFHAAYPDGVRPLALDGSISGDALGASGTLTLGAPSVCVGPACASPANLATLDPGLTGLRFSAAGAGFDFSIDDGTTALPSGFARIDLQATGGSLVLAPGHRLRPAYGDHALAARATGLPTGTDPSRIRRPAEGPLAPSPDELQAGSITLRASLPVADTVTFAPTLFNRFTTPGTVTGYTWEAIAAFGLYGGAGSSIEVRPGVVRAASGEERLGGGSVVLLADSRIELAGRISAPGGSIEAHVSPAENALGGPSNQGVWLAPTARLDATGVFVQQVTGADAAFSQRGLDRVGTLLDGGRVALLADAGRVVTQAGSLIDVSGLAQGLAVVGRGGVRTRLDDHGAAGSIRLRAAEAILPDGELRARAAAAPGAVGGVLELDIDAEQRGIQTHGGPDGYLDSIIALRDRNPRVIEVAARAPAGGYVGGLTAQAELAPARRGIASIDAHRVASGGFGSLLLDANNQERAATRAGAIRLGAGDLHLDLPVRLVLDAARIEATAGLKVLLAPSIAIGDWSRGGVELATPEARALGAGTAHLLVQAEQLDLRAFTRLSGFAESVLSSRGDLRLVGAADVFRVRMPDPGGPAAREDLDFEGQLAASGNLTLAAGVVYPTTLTRFTIAVPTGRFGTGRDPGEAARRLASGEALLALASDWHAAGESGRRAAGLPSATPPMAAPQDRVAAVLAAGSRPRGVVLSVDGRVTVSATDIDHGGEWVAPLGGIDLGAGAGLTLRPGSLLSTSVAGLVLPFGRTQFQETWIYRPNPAFELHGQQHSDQILYDGAGNVTSRAFPAGVVSLRAADIVQAPGSSVDVGAIADAGRVPVMADAPGGIATDPATGQERLVVGGDVYAWEFFGGLGGSRDILSPSENPGAFAILPGLESGFAPLDPEIEGEIPAAVRDSLAHQSGERLYLEAVVRTDGTVLLPAGAYTRLPARYALLPGAFLVEPRATSLANYVNPGAPVTLGDGSVVVPGRSGPAGTTFRDSRSAAYRVYPREAVDERAEYRIASANDFFLRNRNRQDDGHARPVDAGQLSLVPGRSLALEGALRGAAAPGGMARASLPGLRLPTGRGASVDIAGANISVFGAGDTPTQAFAIRDQVLNGLKVGSLVVGATRRRTAQGASLVDVVDRVVVHDSARLEGEDLLLVGRGSVTLEGGATLVAAGGLADPTVLSLSGDGAAVRASGAATTTLERSGGSGAGGDLVIDDPARISATARVQLLASGRLELGQPAAGATGVPFVSAPTVTLIAPAFALGATALDAADGMAFSNGDLARIATGRLEVLARGGTVDRIDLGALDLAVDQLRLDAASLRGRGGSVLLRGERLEIARSGSAIAATSSLAAGNTLTADFGTVLLGHPEASAAGAVDIGGFARVTLRSDALLLRGEGGITLRDGDLHLDSALVTATSGSDFTIDAAGAVSFGRRQGGAPAGFAADALGGRLVVRSTGDLDVAGLLRLRSGQVDLSSRRGDVTVRNGGRIDASGTVVDFDGRLVGSPGGLITLRSEQRNVRIEAGAGLSADADPRLGAAGTIVLSAVDGETVLQGDVHARAVNGDGGSLVVDTRRAVAREVVNAGRTGGFSGGFWLRLREGDWGADALAAGEVLNSRDIYIALDGQDAAGGNFTLAGTLDASAPLPAGTVAGDIVTAESGGEVTVHARRSLTLEATAAIRARATTSDALTVAGVEVRRPVNDIEGATDTVQPGGRGGVVELGVAGVMAADNVTVSDRGRLDLQAGSRIDVSAAPFGQAGEIKLRAQRSLVESAAPQGSHIRVASTLVNPRGRTSLEAFRVYADEGTLSPADVGSTGTIGTCGSSVYCTDARQFMDTVMSTAGAREAALGIAPGAAFDILPGVEIRSATPHLVLAADWSLHTWRFADPHDASRWLPGVLTLRAPGNLDIGTWTTTNAASAAAVTAGRLSDGFIDTPTDGTYPAVINTNNANAARAGGAANLMRSGIQPYGNGRDASESWSYRLNAGAEYAAADPLAVRRLGAADFGTSGAALTGNFRIGAGFVPMLGATPNVTHETTIPVQRAVRTGTGDIRIAAAGDVQFGNAASVVYTAGRDRVDAQGNPLVHDDSGTLRPAVRLERAMSGTIIDGSLGRRLDGRAYPIDGGDLTLRAGNDILSVVPGSTLSPMRYSPAEFILRLGRSGTGGLGGISPEHPVAWTVAFDRFQHGVAALGGGSVTVDAGRDIRNIGISLPSIGAQIGRDGSDLNSSVDFHESALRVVGGGALRVAAGRDIDGGVQYLGMGTGALSAGRALRSRRTAYAAGNAPLNTVLVVDAAHLDVGARSGVALGTIANVTALPRSAGQLPAPPTGNIGNVQLFANTMFFSYGQAAGVDVTTIAGAASLSPNSAALLGEFRPAANALGLVNVLPPRLTLTSLTGAVSLDGDPALLGFPSPDSRFEALAGTDLLLGNGDRFIQSQAEIADLPSVANPMRVYPFTAVDSPVTNDPFVVSRRQDPGVHGANNRVVARTGTVLATGIPAAAPFLFDLVRPTQFSVGGDWLSPNLRVQNLGAADVTRLTVGGNLLYPVPRTSAGQVDFATLAVTDIGIEVAGPGSLEVVVGGDLALGVSRGIDTVGDRRNPKLPDGGADVFLLAGMADRRPDYADFLNWVADDYAGLRARSLLVVDPDPLDRTPVALDEGGEFVLASGDPARMVIFGPDGREVGRRDVLVIDLHGLGAAGDVLLLDPGSRQPLELAAGTTWRLEGRSAAEALGAGDVATLLTRPASVRDPARWSTVAVGGAPIALRNVEVIGTPVDLRGLVAGARSDADVVAGLRSLAAAGGSLLAPSAKVFFSLSATLGGNQTPLENAIRGGLASLRIDPAQPAGLPAHPIADFYLALDRLFPESGDRNLLRPLLEFNFGITTLDSTATVAQKLASAGGALSGAARQELLAENPERDDVDPNAAELTATELAREAEAVARVNAVRAASVQRFLADRVARTQRRGSPSALAVSGGALAALYDGLLVQQANQRDGGSRPGAIVTPDFGATAYGGGIDLSFSRVNTLDGGDIHLLVPNGHIDVGQSQAGVDKTPPQLGLVARDGGSARFFASGLTNVNLSRIFATPNLRTGGAESVTGISGTGDIDAGRGAATAVSAPIPFFTVADDGTGIPIYFNPPPLGGSGIRSFDPAARDVFVTPAGVLDTNEAGIFSEGEVSVPPIVTGVAGVSAGNAGGGGGTAVAPPAPPDVTAAVVASATKQIAEAGQDSAAAGDQGGRQTAALGILRVDVLSFFGEGAVEEGEEL